MDSQIMSLDVNKVNQGQQSGNAKASQKQKFDDEKNAALSAAHGNTGLMAKINAITPHKGAIEELEALMLQAIQSNATQPVNQQRTLGIG